ncbi:MAG: DEAD/DEAH box helicase [Planctomycetota bacterium]|jgi:hypothetical protein
MTTTDYDLTEGPLEDTEAFRILHSLAHGKTESVPEELLVRHIMRITQGGDWPLRRAALEACLRRFDFARRDELRVAERPARGQIFGVYRTRRARSPRRPYDTALESVDPLSGSCDCPDYTRGSLGLCKHLLAVLDDLARRPRRFRQALDARPAPRGGDRTLLTWDPIRPLTGAGDWLDRVKLDSSCGRRLKRRQSFAEARRYFRVDGDEALALKDAFAGRPKRRLELVESLLPLARGLRAARAGSAEPHPALRPLLTAERARLGQIVSSRSSRRQFKAALRTLRRKLYPYQREGVLRALECGQLLLADDMGLGKTAQAIAVCHALWHSDTLRRGLVIAPASLKPQWLQEWQLFTDVPVQVVDGGPEERHRTYRGQRCGFLIANYEQVLRDLSLISGWRPGIVVLDEAQRIKNWATKTATCVKMLRPPFRLVLTGTPMENRLEELASIVEWVDDMALEPKWRLRPWHTMHADGRPGTVGARNLDTLRERLSPCTLRRVRREVLDQLPPRTDTVVPVDLTPAQAAEHDALNQPIAALAGIAERRPLTQKEFLRLMQLLTAQRVIANGLAQFQFSEQWPEISGIKDPSPALLRGLDSPKLLELREMLAQLVIEQERKVVVFSQWRRMLRLAHWAVQSLLASRGLEAAFFSGQENQRRRTRNLVDFHDDPKLRVLFATDAGGVGLNLQRASNCCVNLELPWNPAVLEQRIGRIYRLGQDQPIDVYNLVSRDCIEERIASLVSDKKALFDGLFDGTSDEIRFEQSSSFMSTVSRILERIEPPDTRTADEGVTEDEEAVERQLEETLDTSDEIDAAPAEAAPLVEVKPLGPAAAEWPTALSLPDLFSKLNIRSTDEGGVSIDAPPEAAASLAAVFDGLASLLRTAARRESPRAADPEADPMLHRSIRDLGLPSRAVTILEYHGITSISALLGQSPDELLARPGFGKTALREARRRLGEHGLSLRGEPRDNA